MTDVEMSEVTSEDTAQVTSEDMDTSDNSKMHRPSTHPDVPAAETSDNSKMHKPSAEPEVPAAETSPYTELHRPSIHRDVPAAETSNDSKMHQPSTNPEVPVAETSDQSVINKSSAKPEELGAVTSDDSKMHRPSAELEVPVAETSDNSKMHQPSAEPEVPAAEETSAKATPGIRFSASVEWLDKDGKQKHRENKTRDLQLALQSWLNKNQKDVTCSVLSVAEDGRAEIMIQNASALDETVMQTLTLTLRDQTTAIIQNFSPSVSKPETQITDRKPVDAPSPFQSAPQDVKEEGFGAAAATAGLESEGCSVPLFHFLYVNQVYKEEMKRIERENGVEIIPNLTVSFKAKEGARGDTNNASQEFIDVVQKCLGDSSSITFPLKRADPEGWKEALTIIRTKEAKLALSVSSDEITVFGPSKNIDAVDRLLNGSKTTLTNGDQSFRASAWGSQDTSLKIGRSIKDPLVSDGLTMAENHWKVMNVVFDKKIAHIKAKFDVCFESRDNSEGKVTVRARTQNAAAESMQSHALRALLSLYQKVATSTMSCSLLVPDQTQKLGQILSKHPGIEAGGNPGAWRITGLPETLGPAVDELEKIFGGRVLKEEDKQRIQYSKYPMSNFGATMEGGATAGGTAGENKEEETCPICMDTFTKKKKIKCSHEFCEECLEQSVKSLGPTCPVCKAVFGKMEGNQPDGHMSFTLHHHPLPGFSHCGTIVITYNIPSGIQTARHPNPGKPYNGVSRVAYLPDNKEGRDVLSLLRRAFDQKQIFTVGTSRTTGADNQVTWNDIHHKTNIHGGPHGFGYPDPGYLSRVREELKAKGIE